jgi:hypothetical protein
MEVKESLAAVGLRTCAVGVLKVPVEEFVKDAGAPLFKILGTGFLVAPLTALTNRHVVANVSAYIEKESVPKNRRHVAFLRPDGHGVAMSFHEVEKMGMATHPSFFDIGLITFRASPDDPLRNLSPVVIPAAFHGSVGDAIGVYGYAYGENLLKRELGPRERTYRFGPILQQGYISAIAPYEHSSRVDRLLLDVRTARGMSGSPVFELSGGIVLGVHDSGIEDTVAFAIPLSSAMIADLIAIHASGSVGDRGSGGVSWVTRGEETQ